MIHEYDNIDTEVVWQTLHDDLPGLVLRIKSVLRPNTKA